MLHGTKRSDTGPGTKRRLLETLKSKGPKTARELSAALGGGPVAMRVHLRNLLAAGLVSHIEEHQPIGRPVRRYNLTAEADCLFAKQYDLFALRLAETLVAKEGTGGLMQMLEGWEEDLLRRMEERLPQNGSRVSGLAEVLSDIGCMASLCETPAGFLLTQRNCTIAKIAARFPIVCDRETAILSRVLHHQVRMQSCQAQGGETCTFLVERAEWRESDDHHVIARDAPHATS
jgi:predicted ArsR family transcriptional regulator